MGRVAQLGERTVRIRKAEGSIPFMSTTSEQALYRLLRLFLRKSERTHAAAHPFQITSAALACDLVWANPLDNSIYTVWITQKVQAYFCLYFFHYYIIFLSPLPGTYGCRKSQAPFQGLRQRLF